MPLLLQAEGHGAARDVAPYNGNGRSDSPRTPPLDHRVQRSGSGTPPSLEGADSSRDDGALPPLQAVRILTPKAADFSVHPPVSCLHHGTHEEDTRHAYFKLTPLTPNGGILALQRKPAAAHAKGEDGVVCAGPPTACTPAASSQCNSITDAVMSLPDLLRARSAQLVGSLELGAPLGRGSFGKVYKGALLPSQAASHMSHTSWQVPLACSS